MMRTSVAALLPASGRRVAEAIDLRRLAPNKARLGRTRRIRCMGTMSAQRGLPSDRARAPSLSQRGTRDSARNPAPASAIARRDGAGPRVMTAGRRPTQQRADARAGTPAQLLCQEAGVSPGLLVVVRCGSARRLGEDASFRAGATIPWSSSLQAPGGDRVLRCVRSPAVEGRPAMRSVTGSRSSEAAFLERLRQVE